MADSSPHKEQLWNTLFLSFALTSTLTLTEWQEHFSPGHQCGDEEEAGDDDGSDSEKEESDEDSEPPGDFDPTPVFTLLQTLSSLSDNDKLD